MTIDEDIFAKNLYFLKLFQRGPNDKNLIKTLVFFNLLNVAFDLFDFVYQALTRC